MNFTFFELLMVQFFSDFTSILTSYLGVLALCLLKTVFSGVELLLNWYVSLIWLAVSFLFF